VFEPGGQASVKPKPEASGKGQEKSALLAASLVEHHSPKTDRKGWIRLRLGPIIQAVRCSCGFMPSSCGMDWRGQAKFWQLCQYMCLSLSSKECKRQFRPLFSDVPFVHLPFPSRAASIFATRPLPLPLGRQKLIAEIQISDSAATTMGGPITFVRVSFSQRSVVSFFVQRPFFECFPRSLRRRGFVVISRIFPVFCHPKARENLAFLVLS
jgi:hypothetical protein